MTDIIITKKRVYNNIYKKIKKSQYIAIISHINPDLDTIWSALSLKTIIENNFKNKKINIICKDYSNQYPYLVKNENILNDINPFYYDLIIFLDISSPSQSWFEREFPKLFDKKTFNTINIDHHKSNNIFARQNIVMSSYTSTSMLLYEIYKTLKLKISKEVWTYILAWIISDSGRFMHSNTNYQTLKVTWELLSIWAEYNFLLDKIYFTNKLETVKIYWKIFSNSFISKDNVLNSFINYITIDNNKISYSEIKWILDYLVWVDDTKYTRFLLQNWDFIKFSLRTLRNDIDLSMIARKYNWWWHQKASWFTIKGNLLEEKNIKILKK